MRYLSFVVFILGIPLLSFGQLNVSVIYQSSLTQPTNHQSIIDQFNESRPWLQSPFGRLRWLNGYGFGFRYKVDRLALNLRWENQIDRISASGQDPNNNNESFEQRVFFRLSTYSLGLESFITDFLSIHGSFEFNRVRYRSEVNNIDDRFELFNDWGTGSTFSIGYNFVGNRLLHVSIRPFVHLSWSSHDLTDLSMELNPDVTPNTNLEEDFMNFGIKLIFYNGQW